MAQYYLSLNALLELIVLGCAAVAIYVVLAMVFRLKAGVQTLEMLNKAKRT